MSVTVHGSLNMGKDGVVGIAGPAAPRLEGRVPLRMVAEACERYAKPAGYATALETLGKESMIVLHGPSGHGKRTGALKLLHDLGEDRPMFMLLPDLQDLAGRDDYLEGAGYLVLGWPGEDAEPGGSDVALGALIEKIKAAEGAHLVVTSERPMSSMVPQFCWERPSVESILAAHGVLEAGLAPSDLHEYSLDDLVRYARNLASGMDPGKSRDNLDLALRRTVEDWFESGPEPRDLLEATALVFLDGLPEGVFEPLRDRLAVAVVPAPQPDVEEPIRPEALQPNRKRSKDSLVATPRRVAETGDAIPGQTRRCVEFRCQGYRTHVAAELCERYPRRFWEYLFDWLNEIIDGPDPEVRIRIAHGLALLARYDFDSVRTHVLQPWAAGRRGWRAWTATRDVLSFMCVNDTAAPLAWRTAIRWSRSRDELRRCAAAFAFSGIVGALCPRDALRQLWALSERPETADSAATAITLLYVTLDNAAGDGMIVLRNLVAQLRKLRRGNADAFKRIVAVAIDLLQVRSGERHVAARYLTERPEDVELFAELLALLLVYRPKRTAAFSVTFDLLEGLEEPALHDLIAALEPALPPAEHKPFATQFALYATRRAKGAPPPFIALITSIFQQEHL